MRFYKCLDRQIYKFNNYALLPIRDEDKYEIMIWRNEQLSVLRQKEPLNLQTQKAYFKNVISKLFDELHPNQLLWSFLENDVLVGYGGLVHIDWASQNAEVSFLTKTARASDTIKFDADWTNFLIILKQIAFEELNFKKIFTYAFDLRPHLYITLLKNNFEEEACLKNHVIFQNKLYKVFIHSCFNPFYYRKAIVEDLMTYFLWTNDQETRSMSFLSEVITLEDHTNWFLKKVNDESVLMLVFENEKREPLGQVRIEKNANENIIGVSVDKKYRGKGYATKIIEKSCEVYFKTKENNTIQAYIKKDNYASIKSFEKAGFKLQSKSIFKGNEALILTLDRQD